MPGRAPSDPAPDDWFDGQEPRAETPVGTVPTSDDWLDGDRETRAEQRAPFHVRALGSRRAVAAAAVGAVILLLIGLAAGGVFSGGTGTPTPPATSAPTAASTPTTSPAAPVEPTRTLKPGAKGAQVRALQQALSQLGYSPGKIDGSYGPATQRALASLQRASKLSPDGILGPKTLAALRKALGKSG